MADQLWYTHSPRLLQGGYGYGVRAASAGLRELRSDRCRQILKMVDYTLPDGASSWDVKPGQEPICLLYTGIESEWLLASKMYVGLDSTGHRSGNFFTHVLAGLPQDWSARQAISLWRSPFWTRTDSNLSTDSHELEQVDADTVESGPSPRETDDWPRIVEWLPTAIRLYAALQPKQCLYIVGSADRVAGLIWGLTQVLPKGLLAELRFSTFEQDVKRASARVIGWHAVRQAGDGWEPNPNKDLPDPYYKNHLVLNTLTGRHSTPQLAPMVKEFSDDATEFLQHRPARLSELVNAAEELSIRDWREYLNFARPRFALHSGVDLAPDDLIYMLGEARLAALFLSRQPVQAAIVTWLDHAPHDWQQRGQPALAHLRAAATSETTGSKLRMACDKLCEYGFQRIRRELKQQNSLLASQIFDQIVVPASVDSQSDPTIRLLSEVKSFAGMLPASLEFRWWLLERANTALPLEQAEVDPRVLPWLHVPWANLEDALTRAIRRDWQAYILSTAIADLGPEQPLPERLVNSLPRHHHLFAEILATLVAKEETVDPLVRFIAGLKTAPGSPAAEAKLLLVKHLANGIIPETGLYSGLDRVLEAACLDARQEHVLLGESIPSLLPALESEPGVGYAVQRYLQGMRTDELTLPPVRHLLQELVGRCDKLPDQALIDVAAWYPVAEGLCRGKVHSPYLLDWALARLPDEEKPEATAAIVRMLSGTIATRTDLEQRLEQFGRILVRSETELYGSLLECLLEVQTHSLVGALLPFVELAFDRRYVSSRDAFLDGHSCRRHVGLALRRLERDTLKELKQAASTLAAQNFENMAWQKLIADVEANERGSQDRFSFFRKP